MVDDFTLFTVAVPIQKIKAVKVAHSLVDQWISFFEESAIILMDRGTQFQFICSMG